MPSNYSVSLRFEMQGTGENLNAWGVRLNSALSRIDKAIAGRAPIVLTGTTYALSVSNTLDDEARSASLDFSGVGGCSVIIPGLSKLYWARNGSNGPVTITTGAGATVIMAVNDAGWVWCDGSAVSQASIGGTAIKPYVDAVRAYVDSTAFASMSGTFPGQGGNAGKYLQTNGTTPAWVQPSALDLSDYAAKILAPAIAFAVALAA